MGLQGMRQLALQHHRQQELWWWVGVQQQGQQQQQQQQATQQPLGCQHKPTLGLWLSEAAGCWLANGGVSYRLDVHLGL
jgi:hypothetical protein